MILKIERYYGPANEDPNCWWMLDDIRKVSYYRYRNHPFNNDFSDDEADIFLLDYEEYLNKMNTDKANRDVIRLVCRLSNDTEFSALFDTVAYLCNDDGKTIEKMVANYR